jgi:translation initiation factor IF-3
MAVAARRLFSRLCREQPVVLRASGSSLLGLWAPVRLMAGPSRGRARDDKTAVLADEQAVAAVGPTRTVMLVSDEGKIGEMLAVDALAHAKRAGANLLVVAAKANPPILKVGSALRLKQATKDRAAKERAQQRSQKMKEMRFSAKTEQHDLEVKAQRVMEFLKKGHPVKVSVAFVSGTPVVLQEPLRRGVLRRVLSVIGLQGYMVPTSLSASMREISGTVLPLNTPKADEDRHLQVLSKLDSPIWPAGFENNVEKVDLAVGGDDVSDGGGERRGRGSGKLLEDDDGEEEEAPVVRKSGVVKAQPRRRAPSTGLAEAVAAKKHQSTPLATARALPTRSDTALPKRKNKGSPSAHRENHREWRESMVPGMVDEDEADAATGGWGRDPRARAPGGPAPSNRVNSGGGSGRRA